MLARPEDFIHKLPLSGFAASPSLAAREGDDTVGAGRRGRLGPSSVSLCWVMPVLAFGPKTKKAFCFQKAFLIGCARRI